MNITCIKIKDLNIGYGVEESILKDINLELFEGIFIPLLGPNGIGKTTFVKTLFGLLEKQSGEIELFGKSIEEYSIKERASLISVSLSEPLNTGVMTCSEFVSLGIIHDKNPIDQSEKIKQYFKKLDIEELFHKQFNELSDGQREWVKLARVLIQETKIIFLDEPMSHLDISGKVKMISILSEQAKNKGTCILMSSHDWSTIRKFSNWIYVIDQKGSFQFLSPEDLILKKQLNEIYPFQSHSMFEDNQGEISLKIKSLFTVEINSNSIDLLKVFWLKHALAKLGYSEDHSNKLSAIEMRGEDYLYAGEIFKSISSLLIKIKASLEQP
jgi:iron complex transport system ATP-binding protein